MTIITISRGSFSKGEEVARAVADALGYDCVSRNVLLDASDRYNIPELKLERAIHDAPSLLDRLRPGRSAYIAYIRSALTDRVSRDDVVYHGLAGHVLLRGIDHVFKVRIIADLEDRVAQEMARDGVTREEAFAAIRTDDEARRRWTQVLYGVDPWDPALYDLVVHVHRLTVADAVELVLLASQREQFRATPASRGKMADLALACRIKAELVDEFGDVAVHCDYGNVVVHTRKGGSHVRKLEARVRAVTGELEGVNNVEVHAGGPFPPDAK